MVSALACSNSNSTGPVPYVIIQPLVDSLYAGDSGAALSAVYYNANGSVGNGGAVRWTSFDTAVVQVNGTTGALRAVAPGTAVIGATASNVTGQALVVVTAPLGLTLLLPQIVMLPQDSFVVPVSIRNKAGGTPPALFFKAGSNGYFTIDSATGQVVTTGTGSAAPFQAHLDTLTDTGTVQVLSMGDTTGGAAAYTVNGSISAQRSATVRATNYSRAGGSMTFLITVKVVVNGITTELVNILSQTPVANPGDSLAIDSVSVTEAESNTFLCSPPRSAAAWSSTSQGNPILAVSRAGGYVKIRRVISVTGGSAISGSFLFLGQRADDYSDPAGALAIRGNFVSPLITTTTTCH